MQTVSSIDRGSERDPFPLPEKARGAMSITHRRRNYEAMTGQNRSLFEIYAKPSRNTPGRKGNRSRRGVCLVKEHKLYATPERKQKRITHTRYGLILFLATALSRDRDSELSTGGIQSGQGRGECTYIRGITFQSINSVVLGKCKTGDV